MTILNETKPPIGELIHYGVLGMKWGKTRAKAGGKEIRIARRNIQNENNKYFNAVERRNSTKRGTPERAKADKQLGKMQSEFLKNPDRVTAVRMTRGEKAALIILAPGVGLAAVAASSAVSRRIEQKQDTGKYDKKK